MGYDINKILQEYDDSDDFGFTAEDDSDYESIIAQKDESVEEYKKRLEKVEKIILPFLTKLLRTADQPVIRWPDRAKILEENIQKIIKLTRG